MKEKFLRAIDVCSGGGGWAVAARGLPIRIDYVFDKEIDCLLTYKENHPHVEPICCDIVEYDFSRLAGKVDLILGGIPCEQISMARNGTPLSEGEEEKLHLLIDKCCALPEQLGARWWCYEDVIQIIPKLPIFTEYFVLSSEHYSAQKRIRAFVSNIPCPRKGRSNKKVLQDCLLPGPYRRSMAINKKTPGRSTGFYSTDTFYPWYPEDKSPTVVSGISRHDYYMAVEYATSCFRQLEWQEAAKLQGFPEDYLFIGSLSRVMKQIGQAVQIDTARAILKSLCRAAGLMKKDGKVVEAGEIHI
jgi:site-specific DNA-cytosine methylase